MERFTQRLFIISTTFYLIGTIIIFDQLPELEDDFLHVNLWMFFYIFGTIFLVFTLLSTELKIKIKK